MVSGKPSEQYVMAKFMRFITLALSTDNQSPKHSNSRPGSKSKSTLNNDSDIGARYHGEIKRIVIVVDGCDRILNHDGNKVLHWYVQKIEKIENVVKLCHLE